MALHPSVLITKIDYPFCTDVSRYDTIRKVGQGTFGEVFQAKCKKTQEIFAIKKFILEKESNGFPITTIREMKILQLLKHENILSLKEICVSKGDSENNFKISIYMILEFCDHDLAGILSNQKIKMDLGEKKQLLKMLFNALYYLHYNKVIHRDLKSSNILITKSGILKLADFGLAKVMADSRSSNQVQKMTNKVVTLWYRAPEILMGSSDYNTSIDMWAAGLIMAELWTRCPLLQGSGEYVQMQLITSLCGSIDNKKWKDVEKLPLFNHIQLSNNLERKVRERMKQYISDRMALEIVDRLLVYDSEKRMDADSALNHDFFWTDPMPKSMDVVMKSLKSSNFDMYAARNTEKRKPIITVNQDYLKMDRDSLMKNQNIINNVYKNKPIIQNQGNQSKVTGSSNQHRNHHSHNRDSRNYAPYSHKKTSRN